MKRIILLILIIAVTGCSSIKQVPVTERLEIRERLVPFALPQDSATIKMLINCDSLNQVIINSYNEKKTAGVETAFKRDGNDITIKFKTVRDTAYIHVTDSISHKDIPITVEVEKVKKGSVSWKWLLVAIISILINILLTFFLIKK